jgi:hypothetical protein
LAKGDLIKLEAVTPELLAKGTIAARNVTGWFPIAVFASSANAPAAAPVKAEAEVEDPSAPFQKFVGKNLRVTRAFLATQPFQVRCCKFVLPSLDSDNFRSLLF